MDTINHGTMGRGRRWGKRRQRAVISFGNPVDPNDETSTDLAGDMTVTPAHNGTLDDIDGSWVELEFNDTDGGVNAVRECSHNLFTEEATGWANEPVTDQPNVRWFITGWEHSGATKTVWDDLRVPVTSTRSAAGAPGWAQFMNDGAASTGVFLWWFDKSSEEQLFFTCQLPHNYNLGSALHPHIHWTPAVNGQAGETVCWGLEYTWANIGDIFQNTTIIDGSTTALAYTHSPADDPLVAGTHYYTDLGDISATGDASDGDISSMLVCRVFRDATDANDTFGDGLVTPPAYAADAGLLEIDFHYEIDGPGSDVEYTKTAYVELGWTPFSLVRESGDAMDANNIELRLKASPFLDVSDADPLKVTLFFIKAVK